MLKKDPQKVKLDNKTVVDVDGTYFGLFRTPMPEEFNLLIKDTVELAKSTKYSIKTNVIRSLGRLITDYSLVFITRYYKRRQIPLNLNQLDGVFLKDTHTIIPSLECYYKIRVFIMILWPGVLPEASKTEALVFIGKEVFTELKGKKW